jgi:hypothetical protein
MCLELNQKKKKLNSVVLVREQTMPIERPPLVGKVSTNFRGWGWHVVSVTDRYDCILGFLDRSRYFYFQVTPELQSLRGRGPVSKMASQQEKGFCFLRFKLSRSVITSQREFRVRFKKGAPHRIMSFLNRALNSRCYVITDLDTSKRNTQETFSCYDAILESGPAAPQ